MPPVNVVHHTKGAESPGLCGNDNVKWVGAAVLPGSEGCLFDILDVGRSGTETTLGRLKRRIESFRVWS